jgi:hypothetical protein
VLEHDVAGFDEDGVEHQAGERLAHELRQHRLAPVKRLASEVLAVEFDQVEGAQRHLAIAPAAAQQLERCQPVGLEGDGLAVDQARADQERFDRFADEREAIGPVMPVAGQQADAGAIPAAPFMRKPSCLISCSQPGPEGGFSAGDGRQGAIRDGTPRA